MLISRPLGNTKLSQAVCEASNSVGDLVYINGPEIGTNFSVDKIDVRYYHKVPAIAIITNKISPTQCLIQFNGRIIDIYSDLEPGKSYWGGIDGRPTQYIPMGMGRIYTQLIGVATNYNILLFEPNLRLTVLNG